MAARRIRFRWKPHRPPVMTIADIPPDDEHCTYSGHVDYRGPGVDIYDVRTTTAQDCCVACTVALECQAFTYSPNDGLCFLKSSQGNNIANNAALVSGLPIRGGAEGSLPQ